jgi:preprotein translocase subunit YajC
MESYFPLIILAIIIGVVILGMSPTKEHREQKRKKASQPKRGDHVTVDVNGIKCRAVLIDEPEEPKKKEVRRAKAWQ